MKNRNVSSWAEEFNCDDLSLEANEYNLSMDVLEEAKEVLTRSSGRQFKKGKFLKHRKECWQ